MNGPIRYLHEPTPLQCGQAVLAMVTGTTVEDVIAFLGNDRETTLKEMRWYLAACGIGYDTTRKQAFCREELPKCALLSLETPRCWHWSLYCSGTFYDPEHGVMEDFPVCSRKYYWALRLHEKTE